MTQEYLAENSLRRYPFADGCSLLSVGNYQLDDSWFLDAQLTHKSPSRFRTYLSRILSDGSDLSVYVNDSTDDTLLCVLYAPVSSVVFGGLLSEESPDLFLKLVPGSGLIAAIQAGNFDHEFVAASAEFSSAVIQAYSPPLRLRISNPDNIPVIPDTAFLTPEVITIKAGNNVILEASDGGLEFSVFPGAGTGLYDGCSSVDGAIRTIARTPGKDGDFQFQTGECYHLTKDGQLLGFLRLDNGCRPKCTSSQYEAYLRYFNRINNAWVQLADVVNAQQQEIKELLETVNGPKTPYFIPVYTISFGGLQQWKLVNEDNMPIAIGGCSTENVVSVMNDSGEVEIWRLTRPADVDTEEDEYLIPPDFDANEPAFNYYWKNFGLADQFPRVLSVALTYVNPSQELTDFETRVFADSGELSRFFYGGADPNGNFVDPTSDTPVESCDVKPGDRDTEISAAVSVKKCATNFGRFTVTARPGTPCTVTVSVGFGVPPVCPGVSPNCLPHLLGLTSTELTPGAWSITF